MKEYARMQAEREAIYQEKRAKIARMEAELAEEAARREAEWAEINAKRKAENAEKIRKAKDDLLKATQAVSDCDNSFHEDPSWSHREEEEFRKFERSYRQQKESL